MLDFLYYLILFIGEGFDVVMAGFQKICVPFIQVKVYLFYEGNDIIRKIMIYFAKKVSPKYVLSMEDDCTNFLEIIFNYSLYVLTKIFDIMLFIMIGINLSTEYTYDQSEKLTDYFEDELYNYKSRQRATITYTFIRLILALVK